ncbi:MAG: hypothetical protein M5U12_19440 [Verrucomicrobia bacterium]|nr:hypothetical protein [Verrucomicrobiota bacterium]
MTHTPLARPRSLMLGTATLLMLLRLAAAPPPAPVVHYDATALFALDLGDDTQRRRFWDESHLLAALQGLANRSGPHLYLRFLRGPDDFWWGR